MKKILLFLVLILSLSGCSRKEATTEDIGITSTEENEISTTEVEEAEYHILENRETEGKLNNTWSIPVGGLEDMSGARMLRLKDYLVLISNEYYETGGTTRIKMLSLVTGEVEREAELSGGGFVTAQTDGQRIGLTDCESGKVYIYDMELSLVNTYELEADDGFWYLDAALERLYMFGWPEGIYVTDLESGAKEELIAGAKEVYIRGSSLQNVIFSYVDHDTQMIKCGALDLSSGSVRDIPMEGDIGQGYVAGDTWLLGDYLEWGLYYLISDAGRNSITWKENRIELIAPTEQIIAMGENGKDLSLYDNEGKFISKCSLSGDINSFVGSDYVWCQELGGYFMMKYSSIEMPKLIFWDIGIETEGSSLELLSEEDSEEIYSGEVYERAKDMSERYGVNILVGKQCDLTRYSWYDAYQVENVDDINACLDVLENELSSYPDGFFSQLRFGNMQVIQFELVGGITPKVYEDYVEGTAAFAMENGNKYLIVADVYETFDGMFYHEINHIIDSRLEWDSRFREDALFSEEEWLKYQPEGFDYAYTYGELPVEIYDYALSGYFVSNYSLRYPTEDRATMMQHAMTMDTSTFIINPMLHEKLQYYSLCIRDCFDTTGWPEVCSWEEMLYQ